MADIHSKDALLTLSLKADSGYSARAAHRISADQWRRILEICIEELPATQPAADQKGGADHG